MVDRLSNIDHSHYFDAAKRSFLLWTQDERDPVHARFLTAIGQQQSYDRAQLVRELMPSGFLAVGRPPIAARDQTPHTPGDLVCGVWPEVAADHTDHNQFYLYAPDERYRVCVAGHLLTLYHVLGNGATRPTGQDGLSDDYLAIKLDDAPATGAAFDFVFLEVWREEINSTDPVYTYGSVDSGEAPQSNQLLDSREVRRAVNTALVLRSRIRVVRIEDQTGFSNDRVFARGAQAADTTFAFTPDPTDPGLWRAGSGSEQDGTTLGTTDGYSLAIPIALVRRRNQGQAPWAYDTNLHGSTGRPDGLTHTRIAPKDITDLRRWVRPGGHDYPRLIAEGTRSVLGATRGNPRLQRDEITIGRNAPVRRRWSNAPGTVQAVGFIVNGADDDDLAMAVRFSQATKAITLSAEASFGANAQIAATPTLRWASSGALVVLTSAGWSGLETATATCTIDDGGADYEATGTICVEFEVQGVPAEPDLSRTLSRIPDTLHAASIDSASFNCYIAEDRMDLTVANLGTHAYGILVDRASRGVVDVVKRSTLTAANAQGIARAPGLVLNAASGTPAGCLVTGLTAGDTPQVVHTYTPQATNTLTVYYDYRPPLTGPLPATLAIEMLAMDNELWVSNLGTGGGSAGQPWRNPLQHLPTPPGVGAIINDSVLSNRVALDLPGFGALNTGLVRTLVRWETPWEEITELSSPVVSDPEGRPCYRAANQAMIAYGAPLLTAQWHRTVRFGLARVRTAAGAFAKGELVLVGFIETANSNLCRVGITTKPSRYAALVVPLNAL